MLHADSSSICLRMIVLVKGSSGERLVCLVRLIKVNPVVQRARVESSQGSICVCMCVCMKERRRQLGEVSGYLALRERLTSAPVDASLGRGIRPGSSEDLLEVI